MKLEEVYNKYLEAREKNKELCINVEKDSEGNVKRISIWNFIMDLDDTIEEGEQGYEYGRKEIEYELDSDENVNKSMVYISNNSTIWMYGKIFDSNGDIKTYTKTVRLSHEFYYEEEEEEYDKDRILIRKIIRRYDDNGEYCTEKEVYNRNSDLNKATVKDLEEMIQSNDKKISENSLYLEELKQKLINKIKCQQENINKQEEEISTILNYISINDIDK